MSTTVSADSAKRALLDHLIDDAGLFPPAQLPMRSALRAHARHRESAYSWIGGNFIVPASRLDELAAARDPQEPLQLSITLDAALVAKGDTVRADLARVERAALDGVTIAGFELREQAGTPPGGAARAAAAIAAAYPDRPLALWYENVYDAGWAVPPAESLALIAAARAAAPANLTVGAKLRCGGAAPGLTPAVPDVAAFLEAAQAEGVPWKATAGLHHPVRGLRGGTVQHGFLNLFVAAVALHAGALDAALLRELLLEEDPEAFVVDPTHLGWGDVRVEAEAVAAARAWAVAFGCCSFDEPVNDLRELGLLL